MADAEKEVTENINAAFGVGDFWVELDSVKAALGILDHGAFGILRGRDSLEAAR